MDQGADSARLVCYAGVASLHSAALDLLHRLQPYAEASFHQAAHALQPLWQHAKPHFHSTTSRIDSALGQMPPWQIAGAAALSALLMLWVLSGIAAAISDIREAGRLRSLPATARLMIRASLHGSHAYLLTASVPSYSQQVWCRAC
jgi:hypothetical protein